jgi:hypothetical protein
MKASFGVDPLRLAQMFRFDSTAVAYRELIASSE